MELTRTLAKLTRPRLYRSLQRERLFRWLDNACACQAIWITAPPGSGKTSLVSSYVEARDLPTIWYQIDSGDADPASFFYYLATAAKSLSVEAPLPLLAPEYLADMEGFTRRFFRELFSRLPPLCMLVFDNYHVVPAASVLHEIMRTAIDEVPSDAAIIITSRLEPPAALSRLRLSRALICLDQTELQVSLDEAREIAILEGLDPVRDDRTIYAMWERSGGWAAGYLLMLGHRNATGASGSAVAPGSRETLFRYFAVEIFSAAAPEARHLLLRTAFLPVITAAMAEAITGDREAGRRLNELYQLRYFIDRRDAPSPTFHYHALFREFLQQQAREMLDPTECLLLQRRCAWLLEAEQQWEHACALYIGTADWPAAIRLIRQQASHLLQQGRWQTVKTWIAALPAEIAAVDPWLHYWRGACDIAVMPEQARNALEESYDGFSRCRDSVGEVMAASAIMETYYFEWTSFAPLDRWIEVLAGLLSDKALPSPAVELRARSALLAALLYRRPQHPLLKREAARVLRLLDDDTPLSARFTAGTILLNCHCFEGDLNAAGHVVALLRPLARDTLLTPLNQVWWRIAVGYYLMLRADHDSAAGMLAEAADIADEYRLGFIRPAVTTQRILLALAFDDVRTAAALLSGLEESVEPRRRMDVALFHSAQSWYGQLLGQRALAMRHAQSALACAFETGAVTIQSYCLLARAQLQLESGLAEQAKDNACSVRNGAAGASDLLEFDALLLEAACSMQLDDAPGVMAGLRAALAIGRRRGYENALRWRSPMMAALLNRALEAGIETDYARHLIRSRRLAPPSPDCDEWPWPIRIYTLGRFALVIDGVAVKAAGKAQARPLELLKALIAYGGRDVSGATLSAHLWPDVDGDAAQHALDTALHRLRKLLQHDEVIVAHEGKLTLNPGRVWVDAWAFERLANRMDQAGKNLAQELDRLLRLYAGHFLQHDSDATWALAVRERLRGKLVRIATICGERLEQQGDYDRAAVIYQRGIDADNLSEELYRRLMLCHYRGGRLATAIGVYRRCRQMLSVVLGIAPSRETETAYLDMARRQDDGSA
jgi:ATP/maltotriose-dependent transcriptional regulator MalT/DNA-binding SARP family transcriptional activator